MKVKDRRPANIFSGLGLFVRERWSVQGDPIEMFKAVKGLSEIHPEIVSHVDVDSETKR